MPKTIMIYGANGFTGELLCELAALQKQPFIVAGRTASRVEPVARRWQAEMRIFGLDDVAAIAAQLRGVDAVIHCAGPFRHTAWAMARACIAARVHYLDITGEIEVFERLQSLDNDARQAGAVLLPGAGFDVVPSDCLAAYLHSVMPQAQFLRMAFMGLGGGISHGTAATILENMGAGGAVRYQGHIVQVPNAWDVCALPLRPGRNPTQVATIAWGDVSTAYVSTAIPNIAVYTVVPGARVLPWVQPALQVPWVRLLAKKAVDQWITGPDLQRRRAGKSILWAEVEDSEGRRKAARLQAPEGYTLTVHTALACAQQILAGNVGSGFQTPSRALGADFVLGMPDVVRFDCEPSTLPMPFSRLA